MFFDFFINSYVDSVVMGIRRQLKANDDSISLAKLLKEIAENPESITRSDYHALFNDFNSPQKISLMEAEFNHFAEPMSPHIDGERVKRDLQSLKDICVAVEEYADRRVAHWDKKAPSLDFTLDDIFIALNSLGDLVKRYYSLFFASIVDMRPHPQYSIFHVFREPWIPSASPESKI
jgi:hypothetical protein